MIIDCETHVFERIEMPDGARIGNTRVEDLLSDMDRTGVDRALLHSYDTRTISSCRPGTQFPDPDTDNFGPRPIDYFVESWQRHKERFYWFAVPDPRRPDCIEVLGQQLRLGLQGIGETQPGYQYVMPNAPEFMSVYRFAADHGLPVVLTSELWDINPGFFPSRDFDAYFDMVEPVLREFREVRFMLGHGGGDCGSIVRASPEEYLQRNLRSYRLAAELDNVWICSSMPWWWRKGVRNPALEQQLRFLREHVGFGKVCWGSDWPWIKAPESFGCDYGIVVDYYGDLPFCSASERSQLLGESAHRFVTGQVGGI